MSLVRADRRPPVSVPQRRKADERTWLLIYGSCVFLTLVMGAIAYTTVPAPFSLALLLMLVGCVVMVTRPVLGIQAIALLATIGDGVTVGSWPFTKNLSSRESILFLSPQLNLSPLELWMIAGIVGWLVRMAVTHRWRVVRGRLFWPILAFSGFVAIGLVLGVARGGDVKIALLEARALFYVPMLYVLTTNTFTRQSEYKRLYTMLLVGIVVNAFLAIRFAHYYGKYFDAEGLMDHPTAVIMNIVVVMVIAMRLMHGGSRGRWWAVFLAAIPTMVAYLETRRRAAIVCLVAAGGLMFLTLFFTNRRRFFRVVPVLLVLFVGYLGAFWNKTGLLGFPAQAMKTVIAPDQLNQRDLSSNFYRDLETGNIKYTIRSSPITGIGFGHPFLRPYPLPAISQFELDKYVTHNSMLWIWMKVGVFGFISFLYLFATAMHEGARAVRRALRGEYAALTVTSVAFVLMYAVFSYVDISWDRKSMVVIAVLMAQLDTARWVAADLPDRGPRRYRLASAGTAALPAPAAPVPEAAPAPVLPPPRGQRVPARSAMARSTASASRRA